jgi:glycosyltransferase involved in cell wall biosynthesis
MERVTSLPRVLVFSTNKTWGGSEKFWYEPLLDDRFIAAASFGVTLHPNLLTRKQKGMLINRGVDVDETWAQRPSIFTRAFRKLERLALFKDVHGEIVFWMKRLERFGPNLVWFVLGTRDFCDIAVPAAVCRKERIPYWIVIQYSPENYFVRQEETAGLRELLTGAKRVVFVAQRNRLSVETAIATRLNNAWCTVNAIRPKVIWEGEALAGRRARGSQTEAVFLNLSRLVPAHKGQHLLLESLTDSRWSNRPWRLVLQGDGSLIDMKRLVDFYGLDHERVEIKPHSDDIYGALAAADLFVMTSLAEGMPYAMVEAMATGLPCVGTPVAGIPELIIEGETGWLARSTEVADIAAALERAWADRLLWKDFGSRARNHVSAHFNQEKTNPDLVAAIRSDHAR